MARLGRTLKMWRDHVLARFETHRISNGGTEAVNLITEKPSRTAHGFRTFEHYRLRILLAASGTRRTDEEPPTLRSQAELVGGGRHWSWTIDR